jgi:hypothetical protein
MNSYAYDHGSNRSDFVGELGDAIRQNPVPAALVGAGFLWLLMGGRGVSLGDASSSLLAGMGEGTKRSTRAAYRGARYVGTQASEGVSRVGESAGRLSSGISDRVSGAAETVSGAVGDIAKEVTRTAEEAGERIWSSRGDFEANDSYESREESVAERVQASLADLFRQQPLLLGAVGIAIGAGIAASMPRSEAEDRFLGAAADAARDQGQALWEKAKERGTEIASRGLEEAKVQGITPEAAASAVRTIGSKVAGVAEKASKDISDRIKG